MDFNKLIEKAKKSSFNLWLLNVILHRFIPFNKPHGLIIVKISNEEVQVKVPYKKSNLNHIKGLHACVLATAAEYSSGLLLLYKIGSKDYRIIMESMTVEYHYQAKMAAIASFSISEEEFNSTVLNPLTKDGKVQKQCIIKLHDIKENHLCTAYTNWQIKEWNSVKTKLK